MSNEVIVIQSLNDMSRKEHVLNYLRAVERFRYYAKCNEKPGDNVRNESLGWAALGEAMYWFYSVNDQMRAPVMSEFKDVELCDAFQSVRNRAQHLGWYPIATKMDAVSGGGQRTWVWGSGSNKSRHGSKEYVDRLEGREVIQTLDELGVQMWDIRKWHITLDDMWQPGFETYATISFDPSPKYTP